MMMMMMMMIDYRHIRLQYLDVSKIEWEEDFKLTEA